MASSYWSLNKDNKREPGRVLLRDMEGVRKNVENHLCWCQYKMTVKHGI